MGIEPKDGSINAGTVLSALSTWRLSEPSGTAIVTGRFVLGSVLKLDAGNGSEFGEKRIENDRGKPEVTAERKEEIQTGSLRALEIEQLRMLLNAVSVEIVKNLIGERFVERVPQGSGRKDVRVCVAWALAVGSVGGDAQDIALVADEMNQLVALKGVLPLEPCDIGVASIRIAGKNMPGGLTIG